MPAGPPPLSGDPTFLQDQVLRLSAALATAQNRPPPSAAEAPWLHNAEQLPPLLASYDSRIAELERDEASQRARAEAAEAEAQSLRHSSDRMRGELHNALEAAVRQEALAARSSASSAKVEPVTRELQERLDVVYQENELLIEQQRETGEEIERLREEKVRARLPCASWRARLPCLLARAQQPPPTACPLDPHTRWLPAPRPLPPAAGPGARPHVDGEADRDAAR